MSILCPRDRPCDTSAVYQNGLTYIKQYTI